MGMAAGLLLPAAIKRSTIRAEGERLHYTGADLDDLVEIVKALDAHYVQATRGRMYREFNAAMKSKR